MRVAKYKVLESYDKDTFERMVREAVEDGFTLVGGIHVGDRHGAFTRDAKGEDWYAQAVIRENDVRDR